MRKERKIISSILIISILLSIFMPIFSNAYTIDEGVVISLDSDATELVAGNKITVTMRCNLASEKNIDTFSGTLKYDNTILEFDTDNEFITSTETKWNSPDYVDNNGSIQIETSRSKANTAKSGLMFTMVFNVLKTIDSTEISLEEPINCAYMGVDIWCDGYTLKIPNTPETYRITYNSNTTDNVDNMPSIGTKVEGIDYTIATTPIRTGYTFKEWNTSSDGTGTSYAAGSTYSTDANLELFAQWEAIKTTLTVNPNGGVWNGSSANQTFEQNYGSTKEIDDPTTTPNGYTVRFNANGGTTDTLQSTQTTTFENWTLTGGGRLDGTTYTFKYTTATLKANYKGNTITLPDATKTGATFKGWYTASNGGTKAGVAGDAYTPEANTTLFAQWDEIQYTLTINPNGGTYNGQTTVNGGYNSTVAVTNPTAPNGYTVTLEKNDGTGTTTQAIQTMTFDKWVATGKGNLSGITYTFGDGDGTLTATYKSNNVELETPIRTGYTFDGWYTLANGGTKIESPYMPTNDVTLYAHWTANKYQVTFNPGEDGTVTETTRDVTYGQPYGTLPTPTRNGFEFVGWYNPEGNEIKSSDIVNITSDTTLTAKWLGAELTITFDPDGGELDTPSKKVRNKGTYGELPTPTKPGYTFKGWYDPNENKIESTSTVDLTEDTTLVAKWEENKYTVTFDPGENGTVTEKTREVTYGKPYGELPTPTRPGYTFDGWYDPDGNKIQDTDIADILKDTTFTAKWIGEKHTLIFDYDGGNGNIQNKIIKNGEQYGELPNATKEGHTFIGWFDEDDNQVTKETIANTTTDITVHAKYEKEIYTITFKNDDGTILSQTTVKYGEDAEYKGETPIKTNVTAGYKATFTGWDNQNLLKNVTENREVKATYTITPIEYTIKYYNLKDSDNSANPTTYTINTPNITLVNLPNQEKYIFKGWYTSNDDKGVKVTSIDTSKLGNIILYAQWENDNLYYKSEKYKVGENNIDIYEDGDIYLDKIEPQTTVKKLVENSDTNGTITVIDENGNKLKEDDLVGTGMTIKVTRYDEEITMTAVVMGDLDGNGLVTATDLSTLNQVILKTTTIEGAVFKAADLDDNEKLTATDLSTINNTILKNITLTYDKKQSNITSMTML